MNNQKLSLYALDKKICQMIVDIEKISSDLNVESNNLFTTTEQKAELDFLREQYTILFDGAKDLVTELFIFKQKLNEYQFNRSKTQLNEIFETLAKSKEEIEKQKEEKLRKIRVQEFNAILKEAKPDEVVKDEITKVIETPFGDVPANGITIEQDNKLWADVAK